MIPQVVVNLGSQVNILSKETWIRMGKPKLTRSKNFLKLMDQRFVKPVSMLRRMEIVIMGIPTLVDFEVINLEKGIPTYSELVR